MHISSKFETVSQSSIIPVVPINQTTNALNIPYEHNGIAQQQGHESFENRRIVPIKIAIRGSPSFDKSDIVRRMT